MKKVGKPEGAAQRHGRRRRLSWIARALASRNAGRRLDAAQSLRR